MSKDFEKDFKEIADKFGVPSSVLGDFPSVTFRSEQIPANVKDEAKRILSLFQDVTEGIEQDSIRLCALICVNEILAQILPFDHGSKTFYQLVKYWLLNNK